MRTAGEILAAARRSKGWSLEELSWRTKIQVKFLRALEDSRFDKLPQAAFVKGFVRTAAAEVGLDPGGLAAVFRRDYGVRDGSRILPKLFPGEGKSLSWTPQMTVAAAILAVVVVFVGYLGWQLVGLAAAPRLVITQPAEQAVVSKEVVVEGQTDVGVMVTINGQEIKKNKDGSFSQILSLTPGEHTITVMAVGQNGKKATEQRTVRVK